MFVKRLHKSLYEYCGTPRSAKKVTMALPSPKELKRIAKACREAGIKTFKSDGLELSFYESYESSKATKETSVERYAADLIPTDEMSDEDKLFWSVGNVDDLANAKTDGETQ